MDHTFWFLTRASGMVAYLLLFASVTLGLAMTGQLSGRRLTRFRIYDLHRFVALVGLAVTVFHVFIVLPDGYIGFSVAELLVPFASPYEPAYMALGALSLYLTAFIIVTFYLRALVSYSLWRLIHYATFLAFALALVHGIGAGTDTESGWARYLYAVTGLVSFNLLVYRALKGSARAGPRAAERKEAPTRARIPS